ncbi:MAG: hypothetical protein GX756_00670 [Clostridiales bacterium]|nr:hypothetical protein [Clostridiales bacterium]
MKVKNFLNLKLINLNNFLSDTDSEGRKLIKKQQKFFKDIKVKDKNGNLLVVSGLNLPFLIEKKLKAIRK